MAKTIADAIGGMIFNRTLDTLLKPETPVLDINAEKVAAQITRDLKPVVVNATNSEPLYQSRVAIGSVGAVLAALADLAAMYAAGDWDMQRVITDLVVISGAAFALYGRIFGAKLKPLGQ